MKIKIDDTLTVEHEPIHVFEDGLDWWEIAPSSYVKEIVQAVTAMGCEVFEWEGPDRSVGIEYGFIAFHFPHTEPDGTCPHMIENKPVRLSDQQVETLKVAIRGAVNLNLNTGFLARKFAQIAAEMDAETDEITRQEQP